MTEEKVIEIAKELIKKAQPAYLSTVDINGEPWVRAVENMRNPEIFPHEYKILKEYDDSITPYINTNTSSNKVEHIMENNSVAIYYCSPPEWKGIMIKGIAEIVTDPELKKRIWREEMLQYYKKGHTDPDFTLIRIIPKYMKSWYTSKHFELIISE
jgi:general stress protein 26